MATEREGAPRRRAAAKLADSAGQGATAAGSGPRGETEVSPAEPIATTAVATVTAPHGAEVGRQAAELVEEAVHRAETAHAADQGPLPPLAEPVSAPPEASSARPGPALPGPEPASPPAPEARPVAPAWPRSAPGSAVTRTTEAVAEYGAQVAESWRAGIAASFDYCNALLSARSLSDLVLSNARFARRQMEAVAEQGRGVARLARRIVSGDGEHPGEKPGP